MEKKICNQRNELYTLNKRCQGLENRLDIVYRCDYIKSRLRVIDPESSYRYIITNKRYKYEIEDIFGLPFDMCRDAYDELLRRRNEIVHRYTQNAWNAEKNNKRRITGKSLSELATHGY